MALADGKPLEDLRPIAVARRDAETAGAAGDLRGLELFTAALPGARQEEPAPQVVDRIEAAIAKANHVGLRRRIALDGAEFALRRGRLTDALAFLDRFAPSEPEVRAEFLRARIDRLSEPTSPAETMILRARSLSDAGGAELSIALRLLERVEKLAPRRLERHVIRWQILEQLGRRKEAADALRAAYLKHPAELIPHLVGLLFRSAARSRAYRLLGINGIQNLSARQTRRVDELLAPLSPQARRALGDTIQRAACGAPWPRLKPGFAAARLAAPKDEALRRIHILVLIERRQAKQALALIEESPELDSVEDNMIRSETHYRLNMLSQLFPSLRRYQALGGWVEDSAKALLAIGQKATPQALEFSKQAMEKAPDRRHVRWVRTLVLIQAGDYTEAAEIARETFSTDGYLALHAAQTLGELTLRRARQAKNPELAHKAILHLEVTLAAAPNNERLLGTLLYGALFPPSLEGWLRTGVPGWLYDLHELDAPRGVIDLHAGMLKLVNKAPRKIVDRMWARLDREKIPAPYRALYLERFPRK
ncbi:MAG: hypothetical protein JKY65_25780 [Planctomycetes bacterium]|nr:hypothetical protein [Planctomycetota bacterium]